MIHNKMFSSDGLRPPCESGRVRDLIYNEVVVFLQVTSMLASKNALSDRTTHCEMRRDVLMSVNTDASPRPDVLLYSDDWQTDYSVRSRILDP